MLYNEAERVGPHEGIFLDTVRDVLDSVAPVIDRWPQYAWVAKQLLEAERVSWRVPLVCGGGGGLRVGKLSEVDGRRAMVVVPSCERKAGT